MQERCVPVRREAYCAGKVKFESFSLARKAAQRGNRHHDAKNHPYHCPECGSWHIGTDPRIDAGMRAYRELRRKPL